MTARQRWTLGSILIASLAAAVLHLLSSQSERIPANQRRLPDVFIEQPYWQQFDAEGRAIRELRAERLEQWPGEQAALIEPRLLLRDRQERLWHAESRRGQVSEEDRSLVLEQQVRLSGEPGSGNLVVSSEHLRFSENGDLVETDRAVVIESANWHVTGKGLRAGLGRQTMQLLGDVRGIHE